MQQDHVFHLETDTTSISRDVAQTGITIEHNGRFGLDIPAEMGGLSGNMVLMESFHLNRGGKIPHRCEPSKCCLEIRECDWRDVGGMGCKSFFNFFFFLFVGCWVGGKYEMKRGFGHNVNIRYMEEPPRSGDTVWVLDGGGGGVYLSVCLPAAQE